MKFFGNSETNVLDGDSYFEELRIKLAWRISIMFSVVFLILTYAYYFDSLESFITQSFGLLLSISCVLIMYFTKNYKLVFLLFSTLGVTITGIALVFYHETIHFVDFLWMIAAVSLAYFSFGKKLSLILLIFSLITIIIFIYYSLNIHINVVAERTDYQKFSLVIELASGFTLNFYLFYLYTNINKFSNLKLQEMNQQLIEQNNKILQQNNEKTVLVQEIHHRVKNNLQIVISLLRMQSLEIENKELRKYFDDSIDRIMSMSLIHEKLYQNESLSLINFSEYAHDLIRSIVQTDPNRREIQYFVNSEIKKIQLDHVVPIGLILNELTLNSIKHAFDDIESPIIQVDFKKGALKNSMTLIFRDNGRWKDEEKVRNSFGLSLVSTLVEQFEGDCNLIKDDNGTTFLITMEDILEP